MDLVELLKKKNERKKKLYVYTLEPDTPNAFRVLLLLCCASDALVVREKIERQQLFLKSTIFNCSQHNLY
jgi:hypothetical protein